MNKPVTTQKDYNFTKPTRTDSSNLIFGKVQPQARDLEQAVLGAMMLDRDAVVKVTEILEAKMFYIEAHCVIYEAMQDLYEKAEAVDMLTVTEMLKSKSKLEEVGGHFYVTELTNRVASSANIEYHSRIIAQKFIQRELIRFSTEVIKEAYEDTTDVFDLLDKAEQDLFSISDQNVGNDVKNMSTHVNTVIKTIESLKGKEDGLTGIPSGLRDLDRLTSGWQRSDLIIIASRPAMGKTALTLTMARNAAVQFKKPIAIFSLEMAAEQLVQRLISAETKIPGDKLRKGQLEDHEYIQLINKSEPLSEAPIFIDDSAGINIFDLRAKCRRLKMQHKIEMIIIDYLQLMSGTGKEKGGNREQEISQISRSLKKLARELKVPILALSQLNRSVETRTGDKKPMLSDLRESGAIEQDADLVMFIYRPEYYGFLQDEDGNDNAGKAELIVAKHRNGPVETVRVKFEKQYARFGDVDDEGYGQFGLPNQFSGDNSGGGDNYTGKITPGVITVKSKLNSGENPAGQNNDGPTSGSAPSDIPF